MFLLRLRVSGRDAGEELIGRIVEGSLREVVISFGRKGTEGATATPEWRYVLVKLNKTGTGRQQHNTPNPNLPSEVAK